MRLFSEIVQIEGVLRAVAADPDDDMFLECVHAGGANLIVSGDHHLLELRTFQEIRIISAADFLKILQEHE